LGYTQYDLSLIGKLQMALIDQLEFFFYCIPIRLKFQKECQREEAVFTLLRPKTQPFFLNKRTKWQINFGWRVSTTHDLRTTGVSKTIVPPVEKRATWGETNGKGCPITLNKWLHISFSSEKIRMPN